MNESEIFFQEGVRHLMDRMSVLIPKIDRYDLVTWMECSDEILVRRLKGFLNEFPGQSQKVEFLKDFFVQEGSTHFTARGYFSVCTDKSARVSISHISEEFEKFFLGKVENQLFGGRKVRSGQLTRAMSPAEIISEVGGGFMAETTLTEVYAITKGQPRGETDGALSATSGNIFFVRDVEGVLRCVLVIWHEDGWAFLVKSASDHVKWREGNRFFVRGMRPW